MVYCTINASCYYEKYYFFIWQLDYEYFAIVLCLILLSIKLSYKYLIKKRNSFVFKVHTIFNKYIKQKTILNIFQNKNNLLINTFNNKANN